MSIFSRQNWPKAGDKVKFSGASGVFYPHFTNIIAFAKANLEVGKLYTVRKFEAKSSWCSVHLEEFPNDENFFHLSMFEYPIITANEYLDRIDESIDFESEDIMEIYNRRLLLLQHLRDVVEENTKLKSKVAELESQVEHYAELEAGEDI